MLGKSTTQQSSNVNEITTIGSTAMVNGNLTLSGDIRIDGTIKGDIITNGRLVIGANGKVEGNTKCKSAEILGRFEGKLEVSDLLTLKQSAHVKGEVTLKKLSVEPGAIFDVVCKMQPNSAHQEESSNK